MRFLVNANSTLHANLVRGVLEAADIPAVVREDTPLGIYGKVSGFRTSASVYVLRDEDHARAMEVALRHQPRPEACETCGYNLTGLRDPRCPECGTPFHMPPTQAAWRCGNCGESIEGQFTDCWKCGAGRTDDENRAS